MGVLTETAKVTGEVIDDAQGKGKNVKSILKWSGITAVSIQTVFNVLVAYAMVRVHVHLDLAKLLLTFPTVLRCAVRNADHSICSSTIRQHVWGTCKSSPMSCRIPVLT